jgi:hypothetical protein
MKKWTWILLALGTGVILFLWSVRENFQDTATLRGPPYGDSDYPIIVNLMSAALVTKLQDKYSAENSGEGKPDRNTLEGQRKIVDGTISSLMGDFHTTVYQPAKISLTEANVDTFLNTKATSGFLLDNKAEIKKLLVAYFVNQTAGAQNANLTAAQIASNARAANSGYASMLADLGQSSGTTSTSKTTSSGAQSQMTANNNPNVAGVSNNMKKGNIWGPAWTGLGDNSGSGLGDGDRIYPILLGPKPSLSRMVEGAGIAPISQSESLVKSGALPDPTSTGSDPNSQFFGTSRMPAKDGGPGGAGGAGGASKVPGDQDLFPNPYVEFTPSSGSSKTEPVPYLADFSAFLN